MGLNAQKEGRYEDARQAYERALPLIERAYGNRSEEYAKLLKNWALLSFDTGKFQDALEKNNRALEIENALS